MQPGTVSTAERRTSRNVNPLTSLPWDDARYLRLASVQWTGNVVRVVFANGEMVDALPELLLPKRYQQAKWAALRLIDDAYIAVPLEQGEAEISGSRIREVTDSQFACYLKSADPFTAWELGQKLRDLRRRAGVTGRELAVRAGTTPQNISRVEKGHNDVGISLIKRILDALGASWADLAGDPDTPSRFAFYRVAQFGEKPTDRVVRIETELLTGWPHSLDQMPDRIEQAEVALRSLPPDVRRVVCIRLVSWIPMLLPGGPVNSDKPDHIQNLQLRLVPRRTVRTPRGEYIEQVGRLVPSTWLSKLEELTWRLYRESLTPQAPASLA